MNSDKYVGLPIRRLTEFVDSDFHTRYIPVIREVDILPFSTVHINFNMTVTRFLAAKFKDEYAGDDEKSMQIREHIFQKTLSLYKSLPYISNIQGVYGQQNSPLDHGYHYAFVVQFESEEKVAYYNDVEPAHLKHKAYCIPYFETVFMWAFPPQN
ncbi:hypothetical protein K439DRAFT_1616927 [Ramaria rubella]|nr:hypothetical protein K439DRAFT_1616927 [Ramaria rubella]